PYEDVNGNVTNLGSLGAVATPVTTNPNDPSQNGHFGYTTFKVTFNSQSNIGTYSYTVAPTVAKPMASRIGYVTNAGAVQSEGLDQYPALGLPDRLQIPTPVGFPGPSGNDTLPLVVPGPHVISTAVQNKKAGSLDNEVLNNTASYIDVTFDRNMTPFTGAQVI